MEEEKQYKACPYCREQILVDAIKCRYCQSMLPSGSGELNRNLFAEQAGLNYYPKAGFGKRFIAWLVDGIIASLGILLLVPFARVMYMFGSMVSGGYSYHHYGYSQSFLSFPAVGMAFLVFLLAGGWHLLYALFKDGLGRGQSPGKRLAGLMVVRLDDNTPCTYAASALRNLIKLVMNLIPVIGWLIEPILVLAQERGQRLGDLAAGSQVIEIEHYRDRWNP